MKCIYKSRDKKKEKQAIKYRTTVSFAAPLPLFVIFICTCNEDEGIKWPAVSCYKPPCTPIITRWSICMDLSVHTQPERFVEKSEKRGLGVGWLIWTRKRKTSIHESRSSSPLWSLYHHSHTLAFFCRLLLLEKCKASPGPSSCRFPFLLTTRQQYWYTITMVIPSPRFGPPPSRFPPKTRTPTEPVNKLSWFLKPYW